MYPAIEDMQRVLARLFPQFARCAARRIGEQCTTPFPEELEAVAGAVLARRRGFACGRACAHSALQALGAVDAPIAAAETRAPIWPAGTLGSISHTRDIAAAVVCRSVDAYALGLDLERAEAPVDEGWRRLVLTRAELLQVDALRLMEVRLPLLIFSAKECVHKVAAPLWGSRLDHQDVDVTVELDARQFSASVSGHELRGLFGFFDDHVVTGICLERQPQ